MNSYPAGLIKWFSLKLPALYFYVNAMTLFSSCDSLPTERYGFITRLGNDTISVESVTRQGNTLTSDEVDRFPIVRVRHTVVNLNNDFSIKHLVMDIYAPGAPANRRECRVTADVTKNEVDIVKEDSAGTPLRRNFAMKNEIVVAHVQQMYSLYEIYFEAALKHAASVKSATGTPVAMRQFYIDREFDNFPLGNATVTPLGGGRVAISHDWLSGTGEAIMDSNDHLLRYSGEHTTYKVMVNRLVSPPDVKSIGERFAATELKDGMIRSLSVRDTTHAQMGKAIFTVDYGRPLVRGRTLLGDVIPNNQVWRTGANAATQFSTSAAIKLAGMKVPAGSYTLWTLPHTNGVDLIVNKRTGQWGTQYNSALNLGVVKMNSETLTSPIERFTISIVPIDDQHGTLVMQWGSFKWTAPIELQ